MRPRRPTRLLGAAALLAAVLAGCGGDDGDAAAAGPTDVCGEIEHPTVQGGGHLLGDTAPPVPYSSVPPTSGWHSSGVPPTGVAAEPLSEPEQVALLEAGGVVVTHHGVDAEALAPITELVEGELAGRVAMTPYDGLEAGEVAFTGWGVLQRCDGVDVAAFEAFVATYADEDLTIHD